MPKKHNSPSIKSEQGNFTLDKEKEKLESIILDLKNKVIKAENKALKFEQKYRNLLRQQKEQATNKSFVPVDADRWKK